MRRTVGLSSQIQAGVRAVPHEGPPCTQLGQGAFPRPVVAPPGGACASDLPVPAGAIRAGYPDGGPAERGPCPPSAATSHNSTVEAPQRHGPLGVRASAGANSMPNSTAIGSRRLQLERCSSLPPGHTHPFMAV